VIPGRRVPTHPPGAIRRSDGGGRTLALPPWSRGPQPAVAETGLRSRAEIRDSAGLRRWIVALVVLGALVVAAGVTLLLANTVTLRDDGDAAARADAYIVRVIDVEALVVDAETGLRGYVITGRPLFLEPLHLAQSKLPRALAALRSAALADRAFVAQATTLTVAAQAYFTGYLPGLLTLGAHDRARARSPASTLTGKRLVDRIRADSAGLERLVAARQRARQRTARSSAAHSIAEAIIVLGLLTVLTVLLGTVLGRLVISRDRARELSERTTRTLRESLLPAALPPVPGVEVAARFAPAGAGELVGGDFYDVFAAGRDRWAVVVGDVCGKGAVAASVTAMARWTLRSVTPGAAGPAQALRHLNSAMLGQELGGRFITVAMLLLTIESDRAWGELACAGHPGPILLPAGGDPRRLEPRGALLGVWADIALDTQELTLARGDGVVLYSDGVSDSGPGPERRPIQAFDDHTPGAGAEQLADALRDYARRNGESQRDDIAIVALRFLGTSRGTGDPVGAPPTGGIMHAAVDVR
jgi:serine phosphatase RsbU (regulator of sigma subunit)